MNCQNTLSVLTQSAHTEEEDVGELSEYTDSAHAVEDVHKLSEYTDSAHLGRGC